MIGIRHTLDTRTLPNGAWHQENPTVALTHIRTNPGANIAPMDLVMINVNGEIAYVESWALHWAARNMVFPKELEK